MGMTLNIDSLQITPEILSLVAELDEFKGAWKALGALAPERLSALRRQQLKVSALLLVLKV